MSALGNALTSKLSAEELSLLCLWLDDGRFNQVYEDELLPTDAENFPEKYREEAENNDIRQDEI